MIFFAVQFSISFISIFLRAVQTQNVVHGNYIGATVTSFGMSAANVAFIGLAAHDPYATVIPSSLGGALGVNLAMYYKRRQSHVKRGNS